MRSVSNQTTAFSEPQALSLGSQETSPPYLLTSVFSVAVAVGSSAFAPQLALASWGLTAYAALPVVKESYQAFAKPQSAASQQPTLRRKSAFSLFASTPVSLANVFVLTACAATGNTVGAALGVTLFHFGKQLVEQSKINYYQRCKILAEHQQQEWWKHELDSVDAELLPLQSDDVSSKEPREQLLFEGVVANNLTWQELNPAVDESLQQQAVEDQAEQAALSALLPLLTASALSMPLVGLSGAATVLNLHWGDTLRRLLPITTLRFLQQTASQGVQIQNTNALQKLADVDAVLFAPAIFQPKVALSEVYTCNNHCQRDVLRYAAALGRYQDIPLAQFWSATPHMPVPIPEYCDTYDCGGSGWIDEHLIQVGNIQTFRNLGIALPDDLNEIFRHSQSVKEQLLLVAAAQRLIGAVALQPLLDPALPDLLAYLQQQRIATYRLATDESFLPDLYTDQIASVPEEQAVAWLQQQREQGNVVALIAASPVATALLHTAELTIAADAAEDRVKAAAHVTLPAGGLAPLVPLLTLAQQHKRAQQRNWGITIGANLLTAAALFTGVVGLVEAMLINGVVLSRESDALLRPILHSEIHAAQVHLQRLKRSPSGGGGYGQWTPAAQVRLQ